jgi:hypothetical protein
MENSSPLERMLLYKRGKNGKYLPTTSTPPLPRETLLNQKPGGHEKIINRGHNYKDPLFINRINLKASFLSLHTDTWVYKNSKHKFCVFASKHDL